MGILHIIYHYNGRDLMRTSGNRNWGVCSTGYVQQGSEFVQIDVAGETSSNPRTQLGIKTVGFIHALVYRLFC
jgi:hypothetical protein